MEVLDFMAQRVREMLNATVTDFSYSGLDFIQDDCPSLIVSNHRDIVLDASLLEYMLFLNGRNTTQVLAGENLLKNPKMAHFCQMNKVFSIERGNGSKRAFYESLLKVSNHIRKAITEDHESVWIAQRNGRTKNGLDHTEASLIKMFSRSSKLPAMESLEELHIIPMSISYEFESCDYLKARELYLSQSGTYHKSANEDMNSIQTGVEQFKGRVHLTLGEPLSHGELVKANDSGDLFHNVAAILDRRIWRGYKLWPNNYIAHDMRAGKQEYKDYYTSEEVEVFEAHLAKAEEIYRSWLLDIYANPIENYIKIC